MAGKLGLTNEVKEMKLGKSFGKGEHPCFHTFRYDFMPASLDTTKRATVDIGDGHQVTVTVPHIEGSGTDNTVFKGSKKPYQKECVLIIDHTTGEITLEKLSYNVQLKKTRAEGSSKIRSNTPIENTFNSKKSPQPSSHKLSPQQKSHSAFGRSSPIQKSSPLPKSPVSNQPSPNGSSNHSMPCLNTLTKPSVIPETPAVNIPHEDNHGGEIGLLSSSSSSASSSSDDSSDSSASDNEEMVEVPHKSNDISNGFNESPRRKETSSQPPSNHLSMPTSNNLSMPTSNNFSMPTSNNFSMPTSNNLSMPTSNNLSIPTSNNLSRSNANSLPSMPKFNLLNDDLKLSESDSEDSDD